jgi:NADP-dependent 3-hydroxy acid dehydrogenase YdfG
MFDLVKKNEAKAVIATAASSALGKMAYKLMSKEGIKVINLVRKDD